MAIAAINARTGKSCTLNPMSKENWGDGGLYLRGRLWWIFYSRNGVTVRESSKSQDKTVANKLRRKRVAESLSGKSTGPGIDRVTINELLDDLLVDYEIKGQTLWWARMNVENHLRPAFKYLKAARLGTTHIREYRLAKRTAGLSDSTINRHLALLRRAFRLGLESDPPKVGTVPRIEATSEDKNVRSGFFEHADFLKLMKELPSELKPVANFAYYTGCRKGEILKLRWDQVDLEHGMVRLLSGETKNKEPRMIPLASELKATLTELRRERDELWSWSEWVFSRQGSPIRSMYAAWRAACVRAGVEANALLHDMRRTGVRNLVRAGVPERIAMKISGHKTRAIFDRYNIVSEEDLRDAARKLDQHLSGKKSAKK